MRLERIDPVHRHDLPTREVLTGSSSNPVALAIAWLEPRGPSRWRTAPIACKERRRPALTIASWGAPTPCPRRVLRGPVRHASMTARARGERSRHAGPPRRRRTRTYAAARRRRSRTNTDGAPPPCNRPTERPMIDGPASLSTTRTPSRLSSLLAGLSEQIRQRGAVIVTGLEEARCCSSCSHRAITPKAAGSASPTTARSSPVMPPSPAPAKAPYGSRSALASFRMLRMTRSVSSKRTSVPVPSPMAI